MKNKFLKISVILMMIASMTVSNLLLIGSNLVSYAMENDNATNHRNIEFKAELIKEEETFLYLQIHVKKEGYFNGEIRLENNNFNLKNTQTEQINRIEGNSIYLNQINAGIIENIKIPIEMKKEEEFTIDFLNTITEIYLEGIYRDSTQQDIKIQAQREVSLQLEENNTTENVKNEMKIITNKIKEIEGEEKRVLQISYHLGLQENNYPIEKIQAKITLPEKIKGKIEKVEYLNNMTKIEIQEQEKELLLMLSNPIREEGKINWKKQGDENVILTILYDKDVELENQKLQAEESIFLYNGKQIKTQNEITIEAEEVDNMLETFIENEENYIYKGKLQAKINRDFKTVTKVKINYAKGVEEIEIKEVSESFCPIFYGRTVIKKEQVEKLLGTEGKIEIYDLQGEKIASITSETHTDEQGNIVIDYQREDIQGIKIQTTAPIKEGILDIYHSKRIQTRDVSDEEIKQAKELKTKVTIGEKEIESVIALKETETKAKIETNKNSLSTIMTNHVEIKAILITNQEKYELYKNPEIIIQLPEQVSNITINSMDLFYENELKINHYEVEEKNIKIALEGEQLGYQEAVEGLTICINATIEVDKKASSKEEQIVMAYKNGETIHHIEEKIQISAPQEVIPIYNIQDLNIETMGQEENMQVTIPRGAEEKILEAKIEIINNQEKAIQDVRILGEFPTNHKKNNMGIEITNGINISREEKIKIYYTENQNATDELEKEENGWIETIQNPQQVCKYLIIVEQLEVGEGIEKSYTYKVPNYLDYNKTAKTSYQVNFIENNTRITHEVRSTNIEMETGVGPRIETRLTATVGGEEVTGTVKNGEVIKYKIEVSNTGTEDASDITVRGEVPEGTTMVVEEDEYEYDRKPYYKELEDTIYEIMIEKLKKGEKIEKEYEVRVNTETQEGKLLKNKAEIVYGEITKQSNELTHITDTGNLRISIKRATDRLSGSYVGGTVDYLAIIENISDEKQENIKVTNHFSEGAKVHQYMLCNDDEDGTFEILDYHPIIEIGELEAGQRKFIKYVVEIEKGNEKNEITFCTTVTDGGKEYRSNLWREEVKQIEIEMRMTAKPSSQYVKAGDTITYEIRISNLSKFATMGLTLKDDIPKQLTITKIIKNGEEVERTVQENWISMRVEIESNASSIIQIETEVDYSQGREEPEAISNIAHIEFMGKRIASTAEVIHIIEANEKNPDPDNPDPGNPDPDNPDPDNPDPDNPDPDNPDDNKVDDNDVAKGKKMISGIAWYDENANGKRDPEEKKLSNIKVKLLNTETNHLVKKENGEILEATTNENGIYILDKIGDGKYIVLFDYDKTQYDITKYKATGVEEAENSNAIISELKIEDEIKQVTTTDLLEIKGDHIANINIGLMKKRKFDLKLDKYIHRILIQDSRGTTIREYSDQSVVKVELDSRTIAGSKITIEYEIKVTNQGEIEGYAKKITDYVSGELTFKESLNRGWKQEGNTLTTTVLADEKILPGESKTITLTLTKTMTENNTGLIPNTAEITEDYNELGMQDCNSIPGNRRKEENDFGLAEVMLSIKTGGIIYTTIILVIVVILVGIVVIMIKKRRNKN